MTSAMRASLVIPTWNGGPVLEQVLAMVDRQPGAAELEKVAVDSGSRDETVAMLRRHGFTVHGIEQREFNHGATRDFAIERTRGDVVVLLTQDAIPADTNWLPALLDCYTDPSVGAAYCKQIPRDDCNPFLRRRLLEWTAGRNERVVQRIGSQAEYDALAPLERLHRCAFDNVASSVRRSAWASVRFGRRRFGEDVAFGKRLLLDGHAIVFEPRSAVVHSHNRTPRDEGKRIYCDHDNLRDLFDVHLLRDRRALIDAIRWGHTEYARIVDELGLGDAERAALHRWARGYARWAAVGMYLGAAAREHLAGPRAAHYRRVDRWMRRHV